MKVPALTAIIVSSLGATGCTYRIPISLEGELAAPVVRVERVGWVRAFQPCVLRLRVSRVTDDAALWSVRVADGASCVKLHEVVYGQAPEGFVAVDPVQPLAAGVVYRLEALGYGGGGRTEVTYTRGAWRRAR